MADESQSRNSVSEIEDALWLLHSYESSRDDAGRVYSEADITRMVESVRSERPALPEVLRGKWTPHRCLYLAQADEIEALCRFLNEQQHERKS